jgi:hypothetical protein
MFASFGDYGYMSVVEQLAVSSKGAILKNNDNDGHIRLKEKGYHYSIIVHPKNSACFKECGDVSGSKVINIMDSNGLVVS